MTSARITLEEDRKITSPVDSRSIRFAKYAAIFFLPAVAAYILQPRIGIRDEDAYSYIVGAYSIQAGAGYRDLSGALLNHYPPGYSFILSLFPSPLWAALLLNCLSVGGGVALVHRLAVKDGKWTEPAALGLALAIGFIFLRRLAGNAAPEALSYTLFLLALFLHDKGGFRFRMLGYLILGALISFKLIAVIFVPALVLARYLGRSMSFIWREKREIFLASAIWALFLAALLGYNSLTIEASIPSSHTNHQTGDLTLPGQTVRFLMTIPRLFLSNWYGSIDTASTFIPFCAVLLVALACLGALRLHSWDRAKVGGMLILLSVLLQFGSGQVAGARLSGYGFIALLLACRPARGWHKAWALYGLLGVALSAGNALTQNALGANDPRYEKLARESLAIEMLPKNVPTNSYHVLDVHAKVATRYVESPEQLNGEEYFFWVSLPAYDAIATSVSPVEAPGDGWCEVASLTGAKLFRKCP